MYVADTYIGRDYVPGEVIPEDIPAETLAWLIEAGAVHEVDIPAPAQAGEPEAAEETDTAEDAAGAGETVAAEEAGPDAGTYAAEEAEEDMEPPSVDAMAGIVTQAKPKKRARRDA